ncbi:hypothetical protein [Chitinophaga nivalis]|uniref:DUF1934 domain-containing protein n=1 Tax=Chitinophaga nivalis TaxID=2991709 RepID=A0ABT3IUC6_9BACT|nr:hypothetical protein [Chitinophaga nivalis]MCW3462750.1 hypothetical protein [Chitinophaga nivalis]MCW3487560.1 hypothetical protein [Chitinophaga nivalis]
MVKDITHATLFETLMSGDIDGSPYHLHHDYQCIKIAYDTTEKRLELRFINDDDRIVLEFKQATIASFRFNPLKLRTCDTLISFHRGEFLRNNNLHEVTEQGEFYFLLELLEDDAITVFAKQVLLRKSNLNS